MLILYFFIFLSFPLSSFSKNKTNKDRKFYLNRYYKNRNRTRQKKYYIYNKIYDKNKKKLYKNTFNFGLEILFLNFLILFEKTQFLLKLPVTFFFEYRPTMTNSFKINIDYSYHIDMGNSVRTYNATKFFQAVYITPMWKNYPGKNKRFSIGLGPFIGYAIELTQYGLPFLVGMYLSFSEELKNGFILGGGIKIGNGLYNLKLDDMFLDINIIYLGYNFRKLLK